MEEITEKLIDIEAVIASKNPKILKWIPKFVLRYLKRITHQDEVNGYIWRNRHLTGVPFVIAILNEFGVKVQVRRMTDAGCRMQDAGCQMQDTGSKIPNPSPEPRVPSPESQAPSSELPVPRSELAFLLSGRYILAANHPLGGIDGMALMQEVGKVRPDIVFPVNDLLMNVPGLRPLFIPINKHGKNTENARIINDTFASDKLVLYFPAGLVSRKTKQAPSSESRVPSTESRAPSSEPRAPSSSIRDLEWKNTFIKKARRYQRDVVPVFIDGRNSEWFYNLSLWRKRLGIKANIEMLYLVDEMSKQFGKTITLTFGDPIPYTTFDKSKTEAQWAEWVKERVYAMAHRPV